ncbi:hypothetical protein [Aureibacter tunicatorum]|uniref:Response regulator RpfG family c-di-GMP phosphodiesterase n=1 Tax=Aureibacter tunicatorum TaxID=866807 RepID=A0AAE3XPM2_9BACT|nr:hypothetical protein [Aureibacter tunicatorum]MDR6239729.1 response regulator RpfG family c-di-GMP phosphodiesterase [Aureibacter tunicatorum]
MRNLDTIVIIDDDPLHNYILKRKLEYSNRAKSVLCFETASDFSHWLDKEKNSANMIFANMDNFDSCPKKFIEECCKLKAKIFQHTPLFQISDNAINEAKVLNYGISEVNYYYQKPINENNLNDIFNKFAAMTKAS